MHRLAVAQHGRRPVGREHVDVLDVGPALVDQHHVFAGSPFFFSDDTAAGSDADADGMYTVARNGGATSRDGSRSSTADVVQRLPSARALRLPRASARQIRRDARRGDAHAERAGAVLTVTSSQVLSAPCESRRRLDLGSLGTVPKSRRASGRRRARVATFFRRARTDRIHARARTRSGWYARADDVSPRGG